jgi:hypothetical protein
MKRTAIVILSLFSIAVLAGPAVAAARNDFRVIQNAVKRSPAAEHGAHARWLKVEIQGSDSPRAQLKLTLPIALIELILDSSDSRHFRVDEGDCEIDLKAVWKALKKAGPLALVEIEGDDGSVLKVWLE